MENKITPFVYGDKLIRVVNDEKTGEPFWVSKDICTALGIEKYRDALARLDDDEKGVQVLPSLGLGGKQRTAVVNEAGLYNLIFRSNKPEAKPFKRWVTHEVLPTIRKTGSYSTDGSQEFSQIVPVMMEIMNGMNSMMGMMAQILENQVSVTKENLTRDQLDKIKLAVNRAAKPLADVHNFTWGEAVRYVYTELNGRMGVFSYYHISPSDFDEAMKLLERMREVKQHQADTGEMMLMNIEINLGISK
jgi:prophage antirepressor-like protein